MTACPHDAPRVARACTHLLVPDHAGYTEAFTGRGVESELLCGTCAAANDRTHVVDACAACDALARDHGWNAVAGTPEVIVATSSLLWLEHARVELDVGAIETLAPLPGGDRNCWLALDGTHALVELDLDARTTRRVAQVPREEAAGEDPDAPTTQRIGRMRDDGPRYELHVSPGARFAAVVERGGTRGAVVDLASGKTTLALRRDGYNSEHCDFPIAFATRGERTLVIHSPAWNRLQVHDAASGEDLTARPVHEYVERDARPPHDLDYFHCNLVVSPDQRWIADGGWVWHPFGIVTTWSLERWLSENPWESEDGPSRRELSSCGYLWNNPMCWLDDTHLAAWGYGNEDDWVVNGVVVHDVTTGTRQRWFAGPRRGTLVFDRLLYVLETDTVTAWDVARGARVLLKPTTLRAYHPTAKTFLASTAPGSVETARVCGLHTGAPWNTDRVRDVAAAIAGDLETGLPVLGDALEAAGCDDDELLAHCRAPGPHGRHCWVLDRLG